MYKIKEIKLCYVISWRRGFIRILRHLGKFVGKFVEYFIFGFVYFLEKDFNRSFLRFLGYFKRLFHIWREKKGKNFIEKIFIVQRRVSSVQFHEKGWNILNMFVPIEKSKILGIVFHRKEYRILSVYFMKEMFIPWKRILRGLLYGKEWNILNVYCMEKNAKFLFYKRDLYFIKRILEVHSM